MGLEAVDRFMRDLERETSRELSCRQVVERQLEGVDWFLLKPVDRLKISHEKVSTGFWKIQGGPRTLFLSCLIEVEFELDRLSWSSGFTQLTSPNAEFLLALSFDLESILNLLRDLLLS